MRRHLLSIIAVATVVLAFAAYPDPVAQPTLLAQTLGSHLDRIGGWISADSETGADWSMLLGFVTLAAAGGLTMGQGRQPAARRFQ